MGKQSDTESMAMFGRMIIEGANYMFIYRGVPCFVEGVAKIQLLRDVIDEMPVMLYETLEAAFLANNNQISLACNEQVLDPNEMSDIEVGNETISIGTVAICGDIEQYCFPLPGAAPKKTEPKKDPADGASKDQDDDPVLDCVIRALRGSMSSGVDIEEALEKEDFTSKIQDEISRALGGASVTFQKINVKDIMKDI